MSLVNRHSSGWYDSDSDGIPFIVCSTVENEWVPVFVPDTHMKVPSRNTTSGEWFYYITIPNKYVDEIKTRAFRSSLETQRYISCVKFPKTDIVFYVKKGLIYEVEKGGNLKILLCSAYNKEHPSTYNVFVHPDIFGDVTYTRIKYYVLKYYVYESTRENNEMVVTCNIKKKCFSPTKIIKHFNNVEQEDNFLDIIKGFIANVELPVVLPTVVPEVEVEEILEPEVEEISPIITQVQIEQVLDELPVNMPTAAEFADAEEQVDDIQWATHIEEGLFSQTHLDDSEILVTATDRGVEIHEAYASQITENSLEEGTSYGYIDPDDVIFRQEGMVARRTRRNPSRSFRTGGIS